MKLADSFDMLMLFLTGLLNRLYLLNRHYSILPNKVSHFRGLVLRSHLHTVL